MAAVEQLSSMSELGHQEPARALICPLKLDLRDFIKSGRGKAAGHAREQRARAGRLPSQEANIDWKDRNIY